MPSRIKLRPRSTPPTPGPDSETLFLDETDGILKSIDSDGVVTAVEGGGGAAEAGTVVVQLTGSETSYANVFRGDEDPADTPAFLAILQPGDIWIDTTIVTGWPAVQKIRNPTNDGWDFGGLVFVEAGKVRAVVRLEDDPAGPQVSMATYDANEVELASIFVLGDGSISMLHDSGGVTQASVSILASGETRVENDNGSLSLGPDGSLIATNLFGYTLILANDATGLGYSGPVTLSGLPTVNPADGSLWNDAGVVKVSS